jgi:hypothetical protein
MADIRFVEIEALPEFSGRRGPRDSDSYRAYQAAAQARTSKVRVDGTPDELARFYRSMVQWRNRHKDTGVQVRKDGAAVYVWIEQANDPLANAGRRGAGRR